MIQFPLMSLVTSVKDYVEITHKLIEIEPLKNYTEFGAVFTYFIFSIGDVLKNFFNQNLWNIPIIIPDITSAMISEVSVLDNYFHLDLIISNTNTNNFGINVFEKFMIGIINSFFLILPTSTSHLITLRRFVMQGLDAGYIAGLGTLAGNFLWLSSIILGVRFFVIPWLSLDIFRYLLGFILLVKYIGDSSKELKSNKLEDSAFGLAKWKIFLLNFLLSLTEQSCIYPFLSNLSIAPDASILEGFPAENFQIFLGIHGAYLLGILFGSFSLLQFSCWFWENPAFSIYLWLTSKSSFKISSSLYYKILNFMFLYATMLCAITSIPYYGLDYTITNPLGLLPQDRILDQKQSQANPDKLIIETAFLNINPTDKNTRIRDGVHARRERWKQRLIKYQAFDAQILNKGVYDFLTIEDLNYGFDRFWLRRKMRNHQIRFRLFPGPWMRSLKKQLNNPVTAERTKSDYLEKKAKNNYIEFFRILFEQFYHPNFHTKSTNLNLHPVEQSVLNTSTTGLKPANSLTQVSLQNFQVTATTNMSWLIPQTQTKIETLNTNSTLRKYVRNVNTRLNLKQLKNKQNNIINKYNNELIYSKRWKYFFSTTLKKKTNPQKETTPIKSLPKDASYQLFKNVAKQLLLTPETKSLKLKNSLEKLSTKERKLLNLRTQYFHNKTSFDFTLRPLNIYLQKEQAFKRKLRYYGPTSLRKLTVGNQAPYFKTLMKRGFYYYKPTLRWKKTLYVAKIIRGFRKKSRKQRTLVTPDLIKIQTAASQPEIGQSKFETTNPSPLGEANISKNPNTLITKPTHSYSVLGKQASRYRHQIYKDVLQHWYYTPFNRLLLKFDVDAFINRQPKSHFLTKNEERLLHLRRLLLSEHYDTLRWYTYMQQYKTMKTNIGGTKSFANRVYNQQFQGTFKKIRHLFAITPKQGDFYLLKFDQPLYNDTNFSTNVYYHEELLTDSVGKNESFGPTQADSLLNTKLKSNTNTQIALVNMDPNFDELQEKKTSFQKNYFSKEQQAAEVQKEQNALKPDSLQLNTNFDFIEQSSLFISKIQLKNNKTDICTTAPADCQAELQEMKNIKSIQKTKEILPLNMYNELFVKLIKECKKRVHDQSFLRNYITHRIEKREQLSELQIKELTKRLDLIKTWYTEIAYNLPKPSTKKNLQINLEQNFPEGRNPQETINLKEKLNRLNLIKELTNKKQPLTNLSKNVIQETKQLLINTSIQKITRPILKIVKTRTEKNFSWWRKKQQVMTKRKNSRKRDRFKKQLLLINKKLTQIKGDITVEKTALYKDLYGSYGISDYLLTTNPAIPNSLKITNSKLLRQKKLNVPAAQGEAAEPTLNSAEKKETPQQEPNNNFARSNFTLRKKGSSKGRRYRSLSLARYLTATRKPRLIGLEEVTKLDNLTNLNGAFLTKQDINTLLYLKQSKTEKMAAACELCQPRSDLAPILDSLKKSQIKKRGRHAWKKQARQRFSLNLSKYRKRHITFNGKLRVMNKKLKKAKATNELRQWWWTSFLPRYLNRLLKKEPTIKKITEKPEIKTLKNQSMTAFSESLNRSSAYRSLVQSQTYSQQVDGIKVEDEKQDITFKPLSNSNNSIVKIGNNLSETSDESFVSAFGLSKTKSTEMTQLVNPDNIFVENLIQQSSELEKMNTKLYSDSGTLPFYAGWDDSLRKFVVTNRLLSRRDTGIFNNGLEKNDLKQSQQKSILPVDKSKNINFSNTPIRGLNEGSFLTWQTSMPFNSYNIDQFISTNQSFYAPLGWRRFEFRQLLLKTWARKYTSSSKNLDNSLIISIKNSPSGDFFSHVQTLNKLDTAALQKQENINTKKAIARRIKKRNKLIQDRQKMFNYYSPTGPLLTQVLPAHYISVFDQQYRFPRNRYLKRKTLKTLEKTTLLSMLDLTKANQTNGDDFFYKEFTLRKRVKPRRKYHLKRITKKDGLIFPRRTKFSQHRFKSTVDSYTDDLRWRPSSKSIAVLKKDQKNLALRESQGPEGKQAKTKSNKRVNTNPLRLRQLRRREFQQILKPTQRFIPENGGFTWPGDYLRLEIVEMPKLKSAMQKTGEQRKINVQPVRILPRKYLIEKHNIKVLKKKLEKAYVVNMLA